jgi:hypothetical protein
MTQTVLESIVDGLRKVATNGADHDPPAAVVWTDRTRLWEQVVPQIGEHLALLVLGDHKPDEKSGPGYWIRSVLSGALDNLDNDGNVPVVYIPGFSREDFRASEDCPEELKALVELQYRGTFWSQPNGKDWTPTAFIQNPERGLAVPVDQDGETATALQATLPQMLSVSVDWLRMHQPIRAELLYKLVQPDAVSTVLRWLSDPAGTKSQLNAGEWGGFVVSCSKEFGFDPERDGELYAANLLAEGKDGWKQVWLRYRENPALYPGVEGRLRAAAPQGLIVEKQNVWPQYNAQAETQLRSALMSLAHVDPTSARQAVADLEHEHGSRRVWVWADLGRAPLAKALLYLDVLADKTKSVPKGSTQVLAQWYRNVGWEVDDAVLKALAGVSEMQDAGAVETAITAVYADWIDEVARVFQDAVESDRASYASPQPEDRSSGTCLLFTDGLRFDLGSRLATLLTERGHEVDLTWHFAALPTITASAKPALAPVAGQFGPGSGLAPVTEGGTEVGVAQLRKALAIAGYQALDSSEVGDPSNRAWTEHGNIDKHGHNFGPRLADVVEGELRQIAGRVEMLIEAGWDTVEVVTDHGFLLLPGGLPKVDLPAFMVDKRKGRCARLTDNQPVDQPTVPWRWDESVRFSVSRGSACFEEGKQYEHGGLSPQECVVPHLIVRSGAKTHEVSITSVRWVGLRLRVEVAGDAAFMDLRTRPADPSTSLLERPVAVEAGSATAPVPEPDAEGVAAVVVVLSSDGRLLSQQATLVGET